MYSLWNDIYDPFPMFGRRSVYVISDSQLADLKAKQAQAEIAELDKLIDSHKQSIERLETTKEQLRKDYPALAETNTTEK